MRNKNKTVIHVPKLRTVNTYFIQYLLLSKKFTDLQEILEIKKIFALAEKPKC